MSIPPFPDALSREMDVLPRGLSRPSAEARHRDRIPDRRLTDLRHENRPYIFPHCATRAQWLERAQALRRQVLVSAGLWALLARPFVPGLGQTLIEGQGYALEDDGFILERCYAPGLRRLGGFRTAAVLAAPAPLQVAGVDEGFGAFLRGVYGMMGAEGELVAG